MKSCDTVEACCINEESICTTLIFSRTGAGTNALATEEGCMLLLVMIAVSAKAAILLEEMMYLSRRRFRFIFVTAVLAGGR